MWHVLLTLFSWDAQYFQDCFINVHLMCTLNVHYKLDIEQCVGLGMRKCGWTP